MRMVKYCLTLVLILVSHITVLLCSDSYYFKKIGEHRLPIIVFTKNSNYSHFSLSKYYNCKSGGSTYNYHCRICLCHELPEKKYTYNSTQLDIRCGGQEVDILRGETQDGICWHNSSQDSGQNGHEVEQNPGYLKLQDQSEVLLPRGLQLNTDRKIDNEGMLMISVQGRYVSIFRKTKYTIQEQNKSFFTPQITSSLKTIAIVATLAGVMYAANRGKMYLATKNRP